MSDKLGLRNTVQKTLYSNECSNYGAFLDSQIYLLLNLSARIQILIL